MDKRRSPVSADDELATYFSGQPEWFAAAKMVTSIDERAAEQNQMPIVAVLQKAARLQPGEMLELITTFLPVPGIEIMKHKGFLVWALRQTPELIRTYVFRPRLRL